MAESQVTLAVWRAESAAKGRVYGAIGYTEAKRFEGREDPHLVRKYMEKGVTIQEVVSAVRSLVTSAREVRTVETRLDERVRQWHEKRYPWDTMPWENRLPFSKQHPMAGFVLVVLQEEKRKRRSEERGRLTRRERELVGRKRELEREREEVTAKWEEAILEEGRRLEAYEEAKGRREDIERKLEEGGLSSEERERLEKELAVAKEEEKRAREAYGEAKRVREEIERRKKEIEEEIGRVEEALKLVEERLGELAPEDVREALEMEQEGEDIEGRGSKKEDTPSKSSSSSEKSSVSGSSTSSSSSSEKKGILSSIAEGVSKAVNAVGNAIAGAVNSVVDTASKIAAYVGQEAKKVVEGLTGGKKEGESEKGNKGGKEPKGTKPSSGSKGQATRFAVDPQYERAMEIAKKKWAQDGGKSSLSSYGEKAMKQAEYEWKMEKAREYSRGALGDNASRGVKDLSEYADQVNKDYRDYRNEVAMNKEINREVRELIKRGDLDDMLKQTNVFLGKEEDFSKLTAKELYELGHQRLKEATDKAMEMYGGKEVIDGYSSRGEFVHMMTNKLVRAAKSGNTAVHDLYDRNGNLTEVGREYEYFMGLKGYQMEKEKLETDKRRMEEIDKRLEELEKQIAGAKGQAKERLEKVKAGLEGEKRQIEGNWGGEENMTKDFGYLWEVQNRGEKYTIKNLTGGRSQFLILGEEGMGKGVRVGKTGKLNKEGRMEYSNEGMDVYNDRITVIVNGKIVEFNRASLDSTRYSDFHYYEKTGKETWKEIDKGRYDSLKEGKAKIPMKYDGKEHYGTIASGIYKASPMKGREFSMGFEIAIEGNGKVPALNGYNPAHPERKPGYLEATRIHLGGGSGASWNYSEGCQTIFKDDYKEFMELFAVKDAQGNVVMKDGKMVFNYNLAGYYFLLTQ
ncbi:hypothetical protein BREVNS_0685 [Brevinematales bacterium NS]|nr:hypothetical protein BREVNS_0685 [Brevinematales bacterium NS]